MYPQHYVRKLSASPHFVHLAKLIWKLPALEADSQWHTWWYLNLPLLCLCSYNANVAISISLNQIHHWYLLDDLLTVVPAINALYYLKEVNTPILKQIFYALWPLIGCPGFLRPSLIRNCTAFTHPELQTIYDGQDVNNRRSTAFSHWYIDSGPKTRLTIARILLGILRSVWHKDFKLMSRLIHPPLMIPFGGSRLCFFYLVE